MKVVCIKECSYSFSHLDYYFNIGDQFELALLQPVYYQLSGTEYIKLYKNDKLTNSDETGQGNVGRRQEILDKQSKKMSRIVYQYDLDGNFMKEYKSIDKINIVINFIDGKNYAVTVLQEDFISLPEWRNKQLKELLDEF